MRPPLLSSHYFPDFSNKKIAVPCTGTAKAEKILCPCRTQELKNSGGFRMDTKLSQDLNRFFRIYNSRIADLLAPLPFFVKEELDEEIDLLRVSVLNRVSEEFR
jgi:hypothetical protein